jgi:hypothetical protein
MQTEENFLHLQKEEKTYRHYHWQLVKAFIEGFKMTTTEAHTMIGSNPANIQKNITQMHKYGLIYVAGFKQVGTTKARVWALRDNGQVDAERPQRSPNSERCRRYKQNKRALSGAVRLGLWGL